MGKNDVAHSNQDEVVSQSQAATQDVAPQQPSTSGASAPLHTVVGDPAALPRPKRKRRRDSADRGLPPDADIAMLAKTYLVEQRRLWPELVKQGLIPEATDDVIKAMVHDYKVRHRTGKVDPEQVRFEDLGKLLLGGFYGRFSCDNSSTLSMIDQIHNGLRKAADEKHFVPWCYVFSDYSVTGLDAARQGYSMYKALLSNEKHRINTTYVDDFTRASREEIEWWKLAALIRRLGKRMIGANDGFNLDDKNWEIQVSLYGLLSRLFIKGLREKVGRGMKGAARRGTSLGKLPLGFSRCPAKDSERQPMRNSDGTPKYEPCIDPVTKDWGVKMFEMYVKEKLSPRKIARHFNQHRVDGWDGWKGNVIREMLRNPAYIGVFIWNKKRREYDPEEEKWVEIQNPHKEWVVFYDPKRALVPLDWWTGARKKLAAARRNSPLTGKTPSRNEKCATTLFSGTLFCGYCEHSELKLIHSDTKYKSMACVDGAEGAFDCGLLTSKSTRIIEKCLLDFIFKAILTEERVEKLVQDGNEFLEKEAKKPPVEVTSLRMQAKSLNSKIDRFMGLIKTADDAETVKRYDAQVKSLVRELQPVSDKIREAEKSNAPPPAPLDFARVKALLKNSRDILNQSIPAAAEAIRRLTGPIKITQESVPGRTRGARWIATFAPEFVQFLAKTAVDTDSPDRLALEFLKGRIWINPEPMRATIEELQPYELHAPEVKRLWELAIASGNQPSLTVIAAKLGISRGNAKHAKEFAFTGKRPKWPKKSKKPTGKEKRQQSKVTYLDIKDEVAHMHDVEKIPLEHIPQICPWKISTIRRAYYAAHPEMIAAAAEGGSLKRQPEQPPRFAENRAKVERLLRKGGKTDVQIAQEVGCGKTTVARVRQRLSEKKSA
jgi:DNA invertase Pin-like site-specific DNA recombinase